MDGQYLDHVLPPGGEEQIWELFHENSKLSPYSHSLSEKDARQWMKDLYETLPFEGGLITPLPAFKSLDVPLSDAIANRVSARHFARQSISLATLATLLHFGYGISRENSGTSFIRSFRMIPSGGALYPLEVFFQSSHIAGIEPGLYHYHPGKHHVRLLRPGLHTGVIAEAMVQPDITQDAALIIFITALFERSIHKYGARGYRFTLLEAGHLAQNLNLACQGLHLGCLNIGGFFDRRIDEFLEIDGVTHSALYLIAIGHNERGELSP
ncbi:MAG: nitroreductase [Nitrospira sp. WS238]|nr:nitroreductase [Nitrospira sp. WS238]